MQWSGLKAKFEDLLAPSLRGRVQVHLTEYTKSCFDIGRGWVTCDGEEVVTVDIPSFYTNHMLFRTETLDFGQAIGEYVQMPIHEAMHSSDEIIQGLVFLDRRLGQRSLDKINSEYLHEFARRLYELRCRIEGRIRDMPIKNS